MREAIPIIARIAGLPIEALAGFSGASCRQEVERLLGQHRELQSVRADLVETIFGKVLEAPPTVRRLLLAIKRDCFNGRSFRKQSTDRHWEEVRATLSPLLDRLLELEDRCENQLAIFKGAYEDELERQRTSLLALLANSELLRGVALGSPDLLHNLGRLNRELKGEPSRKEKRLESSLMRYISRAAVKLSPFSTLTRITLADVRSCATEKTYELHGVPERWSSRSLVRVRRFPIKRFCEILALHPVFRQNLDIALNNTVELIAPDRYRFLRPAHWGFHDATGQYTPVQDSLVKVTLKGPVISWLIEQLPGQKRTYRDLVNTLAQGFPQSSSSQICSLVDNLVQIGFLILTMPWPGNVASLEGELLEYLRRLPADSMLDEVRLRLEEMVRIRDAFPASPSPARSVDEVDQLLVAIWTLIKPLAGLPPETESFWLHRHNLNEDVLLLPPRREEPILEMAGPVAQSIRDALAPLARISNLFKTQYDVLHTIGEFARQRWPQQTKVGVLELYGEFQKLWQKYAEFEGTLSGRNGPASFNPLQSEAVERLHALRVKVTDAWGQLFIENDGESVLCLDKIKALARELPDLYRPITGTCLFLQPADRNGELWVLNRMLDGVGRYSSRYTFLFDEDVYGRYSRYYGDQSQRAGEPEFVDLMSCSQGDNLNIHRIRSTRVIEIPGEVPDICSADRLALPDLTVDWSGPLPRLFDGTGRHLAPVHLGPVSLRLMPSLVRFLALFGSSDFGLVLPPRSSRDEGDVKVANRLRVGEVVLRRRRWTLALSGIRKETAALGDSEFFLAINRWRLARGIPDRIFIEEKVLVTFFGRDVFKPQYMDFTSPLLVRVFRAILQPDLMHLAVQEMLPDFDCAPRDSHGQRWAIELQLDLSAMNGLSQSTSPSTLGEGLCTGSLLLPERGEIYGREVRAR